jgi:hypothetical protein
MGDEEDEDADDPSCDMHLVSLANGLALSFVERKKDKKVINYLPAFRKPYDDLKKMIKYLFDNKSKRYPAYQTMLRKQGEEVFRVPLPNSTRVGGVWLLIQGALRSKHTLAFYAAKNSQFMKVTISQDKWVLMAQFEGIMRSGMRLCFEKQGDRVEINGELVLALIMTKINFAYEDTYDVVDVMDESKEWRASSAFKDLPVVKMTTNPERAQKEGLPLMLERQSS